MNNLNVFTGKWHIFEMDQWDEDYFNMQTQANIQIKKNSTGTFEFGLVSCDIDGQTKILGNEEMFEFSFEGYDECEHVCGYGWIRFKKKDEIYGQFAFHLGEKSFFKAKKAK